VAVASLRFWILPWLMKGSFGHGFESKSRSRTPVFALDVGSGLSLELGGGFAFVDVFLPQEKAVSYVLG
jgi:hypothetical protein